MKNQTQKPLFTFEENWHLPPGLSRLENWLESWGVDTQAFKSDRHALAEATNLVGHQIKWPARCQSCVPALLRLQQLYCPLTPQPGESTGRPPWRQQPEPFLKSTGPASPVRGVSPKTLAEIIERYGLEARSR